MALRGGLWLLLTGGVRRSLLLLDPAWVVRRFLMVTCVGCSGGRWRPVEYSRAVLCVLVCSLPALLHRVLLESHTLTRSVPSLDDMRLLIGQGAHPALRALPLGLEGGLLTVVDGLAPVLILLCLFVVLVVS